MAGSEYYDHTTYPSQGAVGSSSAARAEFELIEAGFDKLPKMTGQPGKLVRVNASATALETTDAPDINGGTIDGATIGGTVRGAGNFTTLNANGAVTLGDSSDDAVTITGTVQPGMVVGGSSAGDALRITQTGAGNALLVEDSDNPDATPFLVDASGRVVVGHTAAVSMGGAERLLTVAQAGSNAYVGIGRWTADSNGGGLVIHKSRGATIGAHAASLINDNLGNIYFSGSDGDSDVFAVRIDGIADADSSAGVIPGRLIFNTADSAGTMHERMRIDSEGRVGIGITPSAGRRIIVAGNISGATTATVSQFQVTAQSDVTTALYTVRTVPATQAAEFTLTSLHHYAATQGSFGSGSSVTNQYGFNAESNLTGAASNYGFFGNIPASAGRWNFYANGTAPNYFAGDVRTGTVVAEAASPTNSNASATLTVAGLKGLILTGKPTANINYTLPTGTLTEGGFTSLEVNMSFEWSVINLAADTYTITLLAGTDHTVVGNMVVKPDSSGAFRTRKTAANTFVTYRIG